MCCKVAMFVGLSAVLVVLMVDPAESVCCDTVPCTPWTWPDATCSKCADGSEGTPYCGYGPCNIFGCNCDGGCRRARRKRAVAGEVGLLELLRGDQGNIAPEENDMFERGFGDHDKDQDHMLSKQEALEMLRLQGEVDVDNLPADWFEIADKNKNGHIDPEEFDEDLAKAAK